MNQNPRLTVTSGPHPGRTLTLSRSAQLLGRDPRSEVVVEHPQVSRRHARIARRGDGWLIEDLESTNGTFVNGERVLAPQPLAEGDVIGLGDAVLLRFHTAPEAAPRAPTTAEEAPSPGPPAATQQPSADSVTVVSEHAVRPRAPRTARSAEGGPRRRDRRGPAWIWIGAAFVVLLVVAVSALVLILRFAGAFPPLPGAPLGLSVSLARALTH
jgi:predicted component of type VI protein secretion system